MGERGALGAGQAVCALGTGSCALGTEGCALGAGGAPKVHHRPAQGNALGFRGNPISPERAAPLFRPFRAGAVSVDTQGVALGWLVCGPLALHFRALLLHFERWPSISGVGSPS